MLILSQGQMWLLCKQIKCAGLAVLGKTLNANSVCFDYAFPILLENKRKIWLMGQENVNDMVLL